MSDERGQAVVVAVIFLAIAAAALSGLRVAQERIFAQVRERRAGEAAVEAATAVIADAYASRFDMRDVPAVVSEPRVLETARDAADAMSRANGGPDADMPSVTCGRGGIDVAIRVGGHTYRAGFGGSCSPR